MSSDIQQADAIVDKIIDTLAALATTGVRNEFIWERLHVRMKTKPGDLFDCAHELAAMLAEIKYEDEST